MALKRTPEQIEEFKQGPLDPALVHFVERDVRPGKEYLSGSLWGEYNGRRGYLGRSEVFQHFLVRAGMVRTEPDDWTKPPRFRRADPWIRPEYEPM